MKYWRIDYYKTRNWINTKYIKDEQAQGAINKAKVKNIVEVQEISEEDYTDKYEGRKPNSGRPPLPDSELRKNRSIKFSDAEWEKARVLAEKEGLLISEYVRKKTVENYQ